MTSPFHHAPIGDDRSIPDADRAIVRELDDVLAQPGLRRSPQMSAFLRYVVTRTLAGESARIKAYTIGVDALGKPPEFDPQSDPSVRVLAKRLRDRLAEHYRQRPDVHPRIEFRPGSYVPRFTGPDTGDVRDRTETRTGTAVGPGSATMRVATAHAPTASSSQRRVDTFFSLPDGRRTYERARDASSRSGIGHAGRAAGSAIASMTAPVIIHVPSDMNDDADVRRLAFVLSGMLARLTGTDVRRVDAVPALTEPGELVVSMHALPLDAGRRIDLQLARGDDGRILDAEVLLLPSDSNGALRSKDVDTLQNWVSRLRLPLPTSTVPRSGESRAEVAPTRPASGTAWLASAPRTSD